jgi:hypothetical protein
MKAQFSLIYIKVTELENALKKVKTALTNLGLNSSLGFVAKDALGNFISISQSEIVGENGYCGDDCYLEIVEKDQEKLDLASKVVEENLDLGWES